jgi:hypothetical protein
MDNSRQKKVRDFSSVGEWGGCQDLGPRRSCQREDPTKYEIRIKLIRVLRWQQRLDILYTWGKSSNEGKFVFLPAFSAFKPSEMA